MKNWKKYASLLLALTLFSLALLTGCGSSGRKWRDTDVIDGYCTVERYGKQIDVCVCHDQKAIYFYYNDEEHELLDTAMLTTDKIYDDDKAPAFINGVLNAFARAKGLISNTEN